MGENARTVQISEGALMITQGGILSDLNNFFVNKACFT